MTQNKSETPEEYSQRQLRNCREEVREKNSSLEISENRNVNLRQLNKSLSDEKTKLSEQCGNYVKKIQEFKTVEKVCAFLILILLILLGFVFYHYHLLQDQNFTQEELIINYQAKESAKNK